MTDRQGPGIGERMFHASFAWLAEYVEGRTGDRADSETHQKAVDLCHWYRHEWPQAMREFGTAPPHRPRFYASRAEEIREEKVSEFHAVMVAIAWPELRSKQAV